MQFSYLVNILFNMKGIFGSGTNDFLAVRISSLILLSYFLYLTFFITSNAPISFDLWSGLFENVAMKIFTTLFLLSFYIHTWIGTWAIGSDYLTKARLGSVGTAINRLYRIVCALIIGCVTVWSLLIIW